MNILLFFAKDNIASKNLFNLINNKYEFNLIETKNNSELYNVKELNCHAINFDSNMINWDHIKDEFKLDYDLILVASSHKAESGTKSLTLHFTGNFNEIMGSGNAKELSYAPAFICSKGIQILNERNDKNFLNFEISLETTHHGPTSLNIPLVFIEVGSSENEWNDINAIKTLSEAIIDIIIYFSNEKNYKEELNKDSYIGFGGGHYAQEFSKIALMGINFGHIAPKHYIDSLDNNMLNQMIKKTIPKPKGIIIDWKSLNTQTREKIVPLFEKNNYIILKSDKLKKELRNEIIIKE